MSAVRDLLFEIGCEELPAKSLSKLASNLAQNIQQQIQKADLAHGDVIWFATPRRLAVTIKNVAMMQQDRVVERKGPALTAAYSADGKATPAALGFAKSCGVELNDLKTEKNDKGECLVFKQNVTGLPTANLLPTLINKAVAELHIPRAMRWNNFSTKFLRPVHWTVLIFGDQLINAEILGLKTQRETFGHRFLHPAKILFKDAADYENTLLPGKVIADFNQRKENIRQQLIKTAQGKGNVVIDYDLLEEVTGLVEWPVALMGQFDPRFLEVPKEAIISALKNHQKCFSLVDEKQNLLPYFITIANIESKNPQQVISGNERVIRARLSDAAFFYHNDRKRRLDSHLDTLKTVVFQTKLGTLFEKSERLAKLTQTIVASLSHSNNKSMNAERAGLLAKCDLVTTMVSEFPELQGIMGHYYALADNEKTDIAVALEEQYLPRYAGDQLANSMLGQALAIADRLDTLVGIFGINQAPTGEKDPFGLRRAALGVLRTIIENKLDLDLKKLIKNTRENYNKKLSNLNFIAQSASENDSTTETFNFMMERLRAWYAEQQITPDVFAAVMARHPTKPYDFHLRLQAVQHFMCLPEAAALTAANKRVSNILKKSEGITLHQQINQNLLQENAERELADALEDKDKTIEKLVRDQKYTEALTNLASLRKPIDHFFDKVMVNTDDDKLRQNRLLLLSHLNQLFLQIADISLLQI